MSKNISNDNGRICNICKEYKTYENFHKQKHNKYGHGYTCKKCGITRAKNLYYETVLQISERKRKYTLEHKEQIKKRSSIYFHSERGREKSKEMYEKHKDKIDVRSRLRAAIKSGKIIKPIICDAQHSVSLNVKDCRGTIHAHHHLGYEGEHWKDVQWLCMFHHHQVHRKYNKPTVTIDDTVITVGSLKVKP